MGAPWKSDAEKAATRAERQRRRREAQAARKGAGLCARCGQPREPERAVLRECAACAARKNAHHTPEARDREQVARKMRYDERKAAGVCGLCGGPLAPENGDVGPDGHAYVICDACRYRCRRYMNVTRGRHKGIVREPIALRRPWPIGGAILPLEDPLHANVALDHWSWRSIDRLYVAYQERERAAGRRPLPLQRSRLVREAIRLFADVPLPTLPPPFLRTEWVLERTGFYLDRPAWEIVAREQVRQGLTISEALRAFLFYAAFPEENPNRGSEAAAGEPLYHKIHVCHADGTCETFAGWWPMGQPPPDVRAALGRVAAEESGVTSPCLTSP